MAIALRRMIRYDSQSMQTVTVDQQGDLNRANRWEAPMADPPTDVPITPCGGVKNAAQQLVLSADNMCGNTWRWCQRAVASGDLSPATRLRRMAS